MNKLNIEKNQIIETTIIPNTKTQQIEELAKNKYKIKITEKPIKNKANKEIINIFKKRGCLVEIIKGQKSSKKKIRIIDSK